MRSQVSQLVGGTFCAACGQLGTPTPRNPRRFDTVEGGGVGNLEAGRVTVYQTVLMTNLCFWAATVAPQLFQTLLVAQAVSETIFSRLQSNESRGLPD